MSVNFYIAFTEVVQSQDAETLKEKVEQAKQFLSKSPVQNAIPALEVRDLCKSLADKSPLCPDIEKSLILPFLRQYVQEDNDDRMCIVQQAVFELVYKNSFSREFLETDLWDFFIDLFHAFTKDDYRMETITGLVTICDLLEVDVIVNKIWPVFVDLCKETSIDVKRHCISQFAKFATLIGQELTELHILPVYELLSRHCIPEIRKACVDASVTISFLSSPKGRNQILAPLFISFLTDQARFVMESALISMGPFIATFADSDKTGLYYVGNGMITVHPVKLLEISSRSEKSETNGLSFDSTAVTSSSNSDHTNEDSGVEVSQDQNQTSEPQLDQLFPTLSLQDDLQASSDEKATESASVVGEDVGHQHLTSELDSELALEVESQESVSKSDDTEHDLKEDDLSYSFDEPKDDQTWIDSFSEAIFVAPESQEKDLSQTSSEDFDGEELKSEFGHFLYWREPLPSIEIEIQTQFFHDTQYKQATMEATSSSMFNSHNQGAICSDYSGSDNSNVFYSHLHCSYSNSDPNASQLLNGFDPQDGLCDPANPNSQDKVMGPLSLWTVSSFESANAANDQKYFAQYPDFYQNVQQQLGTIEQDIVPSELLQHFVNMSTNNYMSDLYTTDITYHCAYSLPAVAFTLGSDNWQCLRRTFFNLVRNMSTNIRCILASSLYPIALIIGHEHTSRDLFCAFKLFLVDVDEVRARLVPTFIPFIKLLSAQEREQVLSKLSLFITLENFLNWRFRVTFCEMFQELVPLYTKADHFNQYIIQIVFILLKDKVAEVRNASVKVAGTVVKHLYDLPGLAPMPIQMLEMISDFSKARNWFIRQTFVAFCNHMLYDSVIPLEEFEKQLLSPLLRLALDPVPNVRLTVSRLLGRLPYSDKKELVKRLKVQTAIQMLTSDGDKDVREQLDLYGECRRDFGISSNHSESCEQQSANMDITHCELSDAGEQQLTIAESSQPIHLETEHQEAGEEEEVNMDYSEMIPNLQDFNGWSADASRMAKPMPDYWKRSLRPTIEKH